MTLVQLQCFIAVAETLSFTKAAQRLHMVQPTISNSIFSLENELKVKLFSRSNRQVKLTEVGHLILNSAYKTMDSISDIESACRLWNRGFEGNLVIGYVFPPTIKKVMYLFDNLAIIRPELNIKLVNYTADYITTAAENNEVDMSIFHSRAPSEMHNLAWKPLYKEKYQVAVNARHPLADLETISIDMLRNEKILLLNRRTCPGLYDDVIEVFTSSDNKPDTIETENDMSSLFFSIGMNRGISLLPCNWSTYMPVDNVVFREISDFAAIREVGLAWNKTNPSPMLRIFLDLFDQINITPRKE